MDLNHSNAQNAAMSVPVKVV
ncbi:UNVERIFIED_CONTAM: hypothetical protein GTU68_050645 [Idotea baltica]|nr:hypothetical protein [Idotea baltica]